MNHRPTRPLCGALVFFCALATAPTAFSEIQSGTYKGTLQVIKHDVSAPLRDIPPVPLTEATQDWGGLIGLNVVRFHPDRFDGDGMRELPNGDPFRPDDGVGGYV